MNTTRAAHVTRTKLAATAAALGCAAVALTGCGDSEANPDGQYFAITEGQYGDVVAIDGDRITYFDTAGRDDLACNSINSVLDDPTAAVEEGDVKDAYKVRGAGTISTSKTSVDWTGAGEDDIEIGTISFIDDRVTMEFVFAAGVDDVVLVPVDSDQGKALESEFCG